MDNQTQAETSQALIKKTIYFGAIMFFILSLICWLSPQSVENFIGLDAETTKILSMVLILVAFADVIAVHFMFNKK